ncbi:POK18 protein, partial [Probosciger aterrimus]|nr:POK18 protein [Probosciger aterrimus]
QKLLGDIQWMRPFLKLTTYELNPLFKILEGDSDPTSSRELTPEAKSALRIIEKAMETAQSQYADITKTWELIILPTPLSPTGVLFQNGILCWIHGQHRQ